MFKLLSGVGVHPRLVYCAFAPPMAADNWSRWLKTTHRLLRHDDERLHDTCD